jgi:hypothetical protein
MKKIAVLVLALASLAAFAGTCVIRNVGETEIDGDLVYGAEMHNEIGVNILQHRFLVGFIDEDGEVVATKNATQCTRTLQANASNYYSADSGHDPDEIDVVLSRMVIDSGLKIGTALDSDLKLSNVKAIRDGEDLRVTGNVENDGNDDYEDVIVCAVVFNDNDDVVVVQLHAKFDLDGGDDQDFTITIPVTNKDDDSDHVSVFADAENADEDNALVEPVSKTDVNAVDCTAKTATPTGTIAATDTATPTSTPVTPTATPTTNVALCN